MPMQVARTIDVLLPPTLSARAGVRLRRAVSRLPFLRRRRPNDHTVPVADPAAKGVPVPEEPIPKARIDTRQVLARLVPGHAPLHVGRDSMLALGHPASSHATAADGSAPEPDLIPSQAAVPASLMFHALAFCFARHHPLALRPEVLGYLINHEIAETVRRHPDHYRGLYSRQTSGKQTIQVRDDSLRPDQPSDWGRALGCFESELRGAVPGQILDLMLPRYSTETPETRVASLAAFMDAASPYYAYRVRTLCGIPRIRLLGTPADWEALHASACALAPRFDAHLGSYFRHLLPVLQKIAEQASPHVPGDAAFWRSIYKLESRSGGDTVTGWMTAFVHYLRSEDGSLVERSADAADRTLAPSEWRCGQVFHDVLGRHVSTVPFQWDCLGRSYPMVLAGGILGVDDEDGFITPALSYAVLHAKQPSVPQAEPGTDGA